MKNLFILSITLLASAPAVAMEGQWKQEETETPAAEHQQSKVPSLANLCLNVLETQGIIEDPQFLLDLPNKAMPERFTTFAWKNATQEIIDAFNYELVEQLFKVDYPAATKAIMAERLTLTETQAHKLFESVIDSNNEQPNKHLIACALFVKYPQLQTWENGKKVAELGPITHGVAEEIVQTLNLEDLRILYIENESGLPKQILNFGNEQVFEQAFYDLGLSNPISLTDYQHTFTESKNPLFFGGNNHPTGKIRKPIEHDYSIVSKWNKSLHDKNGNFVCYLPMATEEIAVSNDKKWCICANHSGNLTIIDLEKKSIIAEMGGRLEFGYNVLYFDENNQLFSGDISIQLPYFYLKNSMALPEVIAGILRWNDYKLLPQCLLPSTQIPYSRSNNIEHSRYLKFRQSSFVINKNKKNNSYCTIQ